MKRLTFDGNFCDIAMCQETPGSSFCEDGYCTQRKVWDRLKQYEDIGLEPEKIVFLKNVVDDAFSDKPEFTEHIRELLRAEKDGRVVVLPCRVGDRIYRVVDDCTFPGDCETKRMCKGCEYRNLYIEQTRFRLYLLTEDGKIRRGYYRTREEAEKALED